ncbi:hypothetical protein EJ05DRAFT_28003 [Pseudovirgaria hyperparasitica]|uniref:Uncharacterized protein n=1 Tax=Pseudovirgaria hyperparasitica TaxID=470096 RepID=A0A6A6WLZ4_9PEZI|nr:uncharacterized protein EJ05DRAFT_28003 [Pseudovirgaria hyperparasitica]KAF2763166.1 hypothetical protein EJ05DRAFT_28003 [Pseudovirgaria hyperparasitica]
MVPSKNTVRRLGRALVALYPLCTFTMFVRRKPCCTALPLRPCPCPWSWPLTSEIRMYRMSNQPQPRGRPAWPQSMKLHDEASDFLLSHHLICT